jgi:hypothetical protein
MAANSNFLKGHPDWSSGLVPVVSVDDLARVWQIQEDKQKLTPGRDFVIGLDEYQRACSKDADIIAVCTRSDMLRTLLKLREAGTLDIPHVHHGVPNDAVFGAMATLPMCAAERGVRHDGFPFQMEELLRLIKEYGY